MADARLPALTSATPAAADHIYFVDVSDPTDHVTGSSRRCTVAELLALASPGGSSGAIQYNNAGSFGGSAATLTAAGTLTIPSGEFLTLPNGTEAAPSLQVGSSTVGLQRPSTSQWLGVTANGACHWIFDNRSAPVLRLGSTTQVGFCSGSPSQAGVDTVISRFSSGGVNIPVQAADKLGLNIDLFTGQTADAIRVRNASVADQFRVSAAGQVYASGYNPVAGNNNVFIWGASASAAINLFPAGSSSTGWKVGGADDNGTHLSPVADNAVDVGALAIGAAGKRVRYVHVGTGVGIGLAAGTAPSDPLHVNGVSRFTVSGDATNYVRISPSGNLTVDFDGINNSGTANYYFTGGSNIARRVGLVCGATPYFAAPSNGSYSWSSGNVGAAAIDTSLSRAAAGYVGVTTGFRTGNGTTSAPAYSFTNDTNTGLWLNGAGNACLTASGTTLWQANVAGMRLASGLAITWSSGAAESIAADTVIGRYSTGGVLIAATAADDPCLVLDGFTGATQSRLMVRDASGNVGIRFSATGGYVVTQQGGSGGYHFGTSSSNLANETTVAGFTYDAAAGHVTLATSHFVSSADNTYDLGKTAARWRTGYFGTSVVVGAGSSTVPNLAVSGATTTGISYNTGTMYWIVTGAPKFSISASIVYAPAIAFDYANGDCGFARSAANKVVVTDGASGAGSLVFRDAGNIELGTTTGTKIGTATTQKLGLWNATPVVQPSSTGQTAGFTAGAGSAVDSAATFTGGTGSTAYTIGDVVKHLKAIGALAA